METMTRPKRTREEVRAAFKDYLRRKKEYEEEIIARYEMRKLQGFYNS